MTHPRIVSHGNLHVRNIVETRDVMRPVSESISLITQWFERQTLVLNVGKNLDEYLVRFTKQRRSLLCIICFHSKTSIDKRNTIIQQ
jgi:hypothetical protein